MKNKIIQLNPLAALLTAALIGLMSPALAQNVSISPTGNAPDNSAALDIRDFTDKGVLIPRLTTAQRNAIPSPALSLLIFNITTMCYEWWNGTTWIQMGCGNCTSAPSGVSAMATPNPVCQGQTLNLQGSGTNVTSWNWIGPNGFSSTLQNPTITNITTAGAGTYTLIASNACGSSTATIAVTVDTAPTGVSASASPNPVCAGTTLSLSGSATGATSWSWSGPNGFTSTLQNPTISGITTAGAGIYTLTASNSCGSSTATTASVTVGGGTGTVTFYYTGSVQTWTVPPCVTSITVDVRGAQGANASDRLPSNATGGLGGRATGVLSVSPSQVLYIYVGGQGSPSGAGGWNGGGAGGTSSPGGGCFGGSAGGGGGMSDIRIGGTSWSNIVIAAGGGGGAGRDYCNGTCQPCGCGGSGGGGGGTNGINGGAAYNCGYGYPGSGINGGGGGTQSAGGAGGTGDGGGPSGTAGGPGFGGNGANGSYDVAGGGGGGGYYGGGGGGGAASGSGVGGGGGGGGSSYIGGVTNGATYPAVQSGDGLVIISW
jgi:hypothetical protein